MDFRRHRRQRKWHGRPMYVVAIGTGLAALVLVVASGVAAPLAERPTIPTSAPPSVARQAFLAAERALANGDHAAFRRLAEKLRDYPLYPYLVFEQIEGNLDHAKPAEVHDFLERYQDTPLAAQLQNDWLQTLARRHQWEQFLITYQPASGDALQCVYAQALLSTHHDAQALPIIRSLWLSGQSRPESCDQVFAVWRRAGHLTPELVWERIHLAMQAGQPALASYLARYLPAVERDGVALWKRVRHNPALVLTEKHLLAPTPGRPQLAGWILSDGMRRLAHLDPTSAAAFWADHGASAPVTPNERATIDRAIALELADAGSAQAGQWLARVKDPETLRQLRTKHIVAALRDGDWEQVLDWVDALVPAERNKPRWRYWRARALEAMGRKAPAKRLYMALATERSYYGFLAADRAGTHYRFDQRPLVYRADALHEVADLPGIQRARELFYLGRVVEARREWRAALSRLDERQLLKAAQLANQWGWHDRAILTLGRARYWDDLKLRFPLAYQKEVESAAASRDIDPAWAFAVIRQESAFTPDAQSRTGALGLMQLMPRTAHQMARSLQLHLSNRFALFDVDTNIQLGVKYLKRVENLFSGHTVLATAAYNAGSQRVLSWQPEAEPMAADVWVETVPYAETRNYLRRVMAYTIIYQQRLGRSVVPLHRRMRAIPARTTQSASVEHNHGGRDL